MSKNRSGAGRRAAPNEYTTDPMATPGRRVRVPLLALSALFVLTLVISVTALAGRIDSFNTDRNAPVHAFINIEQTEFEFFDRTVEIEEATGDGGEPIIRVRYGSGEDAEVLSIPVEIEPRHELPTLFDRHRDWFTVVLFGDRAGMSYPEFERAVTTGAVTPRLVIATRSPFGVEAPKDKKFEDIEHERNWMWGESRRDRWLFRYYEPLPDGSIRVHRPLRFPESGKSLARRQNYADLRGEEIPERKPGEIREYTWQYGVALKLSPRPPAITMENQALRNAGWTLPASAASVLGIFVTLFFAFAPVRTRGKETGST